MEYRTLGRTGLQVGPIGLGTEYLVGQSREAVAAVVGEATDQGVNYIDVLFSYAEYLDNLGAVLAGRRDEVALTVHLGSAETHGQYRRSRDVAECRRSFHDMLRRLRTDHADIIFVHNCDEQGDYDVIMAAGGLLELAEELRLAGRGRFIGFSSHSVPVPVQAVQSGRYDVLMMAVNAAFDAAPSEAAAPWDQWSPAGDGSRARRSLCQLCARENVGLVAMKPFGGGWMLRRSADGPPATPVQCLSYVLDRPGVSTVVPGVKSVAELLAALHTLEATAEERDYSALLAGSGWNPGRTCTYCNHCTPCTQGIPIGQTMRLLDLAWHGATATLREEYLALPGAPASACVACGKCRARCPFGVDTTGRIRHAAALFEGQERP